MMKQKNEKIVEAVFRMNVYNYQVYFSLKECSSSFLSLKNKQTNRKESLIKSRLLESCHNHLSKLYYSTEVYSIPFIVTLFLLLIS